MGERPPLPLLACGAQVIMIQPLPGHGHLLCYLRHSHLPVGLVRHLPGKVDEHLTGSDLQIGDGRGAATDVQVQRGLYILPRTSNDPLQHTPPRLLPIISPHGPYHPTYQQRKTV